MFFVSEEFLRRHESGEEVQSTLGEVVQYDETLFPDEQAQKAARRDAVRTKDSVSRPTAKA